MVGGECFCAGFCNDRAVPGWLLKMAEDMTVQEKDSWQSGCPKNATVWASICWYMVWKQFFLGFSSQCIQINFTTTLPPPQPPLSHSATNISPISQDSPGTPKRPVSCHCWPLRHLGQGACLAEVQLCGVAFGNGESGQSFAEHGRAGIFGGRIHEWQRYVFHFRPSISS